jgi:hypothetical protein
LEEVAKLQFYVRSPEEIKEELPVQPPKGEVIEGSKFVVSDMQIDQFKVKPNEPVAISVAVKNEGEKGVGSGNTETLHFLVSKELPGTYKITIPGTDIVKIFFVQAAGEEDIEETPEPSPSPTSATIGDIIQKSAERSTTSTQEETQESPRRGELMWGLFASNRKELSTEYVLLSSVFDLICHQISLTKVVSFFVV